MIMGKKIFAAHNNPSQKAHTENKEDRVTLSLNGSYLVLMANPEWIESIISSLWPSQLKFTLPKANTASFFSL